MDLPSRLFTGSLPPSSVVWVVGHQLLWTAALLGLGRLALTRGLRRLVVQGG
jgi:ABC-2 type transport system permease protein